MTVDVFHIGVQHYLVVALGLLAMGLYTLATRRNAIGILLGVELILNAANLNFVAFSSFGAGDIGGQVTAIFVIALAAAESVVALAIVLAIFNRYRSIELDKVSRMKE